MCINKSQVLSLAKGASYLAVVLFFSMLGHKEKPSTSNNAVAPHTEATYLKYKQDLSAIQAAMIADSVRAQAMQDSINKQK